MAATVTPALDLALAPPIASTETPIPTPQPNELKSRARAFIAEERFNRRFTLPATDKHNELTVTYAVGGVEVDNAPTVLFIGGMYGGRLLASMTDHVAQSFGMRTVVVDRPGMGASTMVDVSLRLTVWLETIPFLLRIINAQHVSLAAHSCGAIYALNTIHEMPWIIPPSNRKLYLFAPWVNTEHSGLSMLSISSCLPSLLINKFDSVVRGVNSIIPPTLHFSSAISSAVSSPFTAYQEVPSSRELGTRRPKPRHERDEVCREFCGVSAAESSARSTEVMRALFEENTLGANHEALLSLRKGVAGGWGACDDYARYPVALEAKLREALRETQAATSQKSGQKGQIPSDEPFTVHTFWAEKDNMITERGKNYFDKCFERYTEAEEGTAGDGAERKYLLYKSEVVPETTHDTVCLPQYKALSKVFKDILGQFK